MGLSESIRKTLKEKAKKSASQMPVQYDQIGILVDISESMTGHDSQKYRPISIAFSLRDMLIENAKNWDIVYTPGKSINDYNLAKPFGATSLSMGLVNLIEKDPEAVFVLSDGYENCPAGRFDETVESIRQLGIKTPIYQLSPVFASEAKGLRTLSGDVPALAVTQPYSLGISLIKGLIKNDIERGVQALISTSLNRLKANSLNGKERKGVKDV